MDDREWTEATATKRTRAEPNRLLVWANVVAAVASILALATWERHAYVSFLGHRLLAPLAITIGLPLGAYTIYLLHQQGRVILMTWTVAGVVVLFGIANTAVHDAHKLHYENCWKIRGNDASSIWECAPGRSHPAEWPHSYDPDSGEEHSGNFCEFLNDTSSGGTIWRCEKS